MNYYNVEFWKNAESPRKGAADKNTYQHAWTKQEAEEQARTQFGLFPDRFKYSWACRVTSVTPEAPEPPMEMILPTPEIVSPAGGAASGVGAAEAPSAVAERAVPAGPVYVSELELSDRAKSALAEHGLGTVEQLRVIDDLTEIPGVGPAVASEIAEAVG